MSTSTAILVTETGARVLESPDCWQAPSGLHDRQAPRKHLVQLDHTARNGLSSLAARGRDQRLSEDVESYLRRAKHRTPATPPVRGGEAVSAEA